MNIGSWIERWADFCPNKAAIHFEGQTITYVALAARTRSLAAALEGLGITPGDRVAFLGLNHPDVIATLFACARIGAIFLPLNWRLTHPEHAHIIADAEPRVLVATEAYRTQAEALRDAAPALALAAVDFVARGWHALKDLIGVGPIAQNIGLEAPVLLVYTSGTTGRPKGAVLTQDALFWNAVNATHAHDLTSADHVLTVLPLFHVGALNIQTLPALHAGATVTLHARFEPELCLRTIAQARPTLTVLVPAAAQAVIAHPLWAQTDLSALRLVNTGSSIIPIPMIEAFHARGVPVVQVYGATETAPIAIYLRREDAHRVGSTGKAAIHCDAKAVDAEGAEVAPGVNGEIYVRGPNVFAGYWRNPAATAEAMRDGWFATGDIGFKDAEGFWYVTDRKKDMIISGGENIYPAEVEAVLQTDAGIAECAVVGRKDARWGEVAVALVVCKAGHSRTSGDILGLCEGRLARFKHPRDVIFVETLPRNAMGKVVKGELRRDVERWAANGGKERASAAGSGLNP